jgi:PKD domain-containing protein
MRLPFDRTTDSRLGPRLALTAVLAVGAVAVLGCGDDNSGGGNEGRFNASGKVDHFAGPTPLVVRFAASSKNGDGKVLYRWRFDDGTSTTQPEATHTFKRPGYYQVILDARDESGENDRESFLFGAWPPGQWAKAQRTTLTKKGAERTQEVQQQRTDVRRRALRKELRRRAREQIQG